MSDTPDAELLEQFVRNHSEAAFAVLVQRYIGLVYSVAFRKTGNPQQAEDVTQAVFIILARKAGSLGPKTVLPGWLHNTARLTAANLQRAELRRIRREQEAFMQSTMNESAPDALWRELSPLLDDAVSSLGVSDRDAIVLRFFQNRNMSEVGAALGASENATRMRVNRALEKLRKFFKKRGVVSTTAILAGIISANSAQAAPAGLAKTISTVALSKGAAASVSTLTLAKGALKIMAWTKAKTAIVVGVAALLAAGTATVGIKEIAAHRHVQWQKKYDLSVLDSLPPQVKFLPSLPSTLQSHLHVLGGRNGKVLALGQSVPDLVMLAYGVHPAQLIWNVPVPEGEYDFVATYPQIGDNIKAGQDEIKKIFGLTGRHEMIETNVLILTVKSPDATGLVPTAGQFSGNEGPDFYSAHDRDINTLVDYLERNLGIVIIDQTKLAGSFDIDFKWDETPDGLKQVLLDELGLILTPSSQTVDFVIVEKAK